jgi:hypothetical protein
MSEDRILAAKAKVQRLLDANVIKEIKYSEWLANVVLSATHFESPRCISTCTKIMHKYAQNTEMAHRYV